MTLFRPHSPAWSILTDDAVSNGSAASGNQSPAQWFSPNPSPVLPSPRSDSKGKARAVEDDRLLRVDTRSFDRSRRLNVDLEGCSPPKRRASGFGLGLGLSGMGEVEQKGSSPLGLRLRAPPQPSTSLWKAPRLENTLSRLTRRRVSPGSPLPLLAPSPARSFSSESNSSTTSSSSAGSILHLPVSLRLQRASRPHRGKRKRSTIESSALYTCGILCMLAFIVFCGTRTSLAPTARWQSFEGGGLVATESRQSPISRPRPSSESWSSRVWRRNDIFAPQRDTLILYRILGNDLPPRHTHGQTLRNVRFMLENEHKFTDLPGSINRVEKYYVLNRIASEQTVTSLLSLLAEFSVPSENILFLPFEWDKYAEAPLQWHSGVADYPAIWDLQRPDYDPPSPFETLNATGEMTEERRLQTDVMGRLRAIDFTYHYKNQYAINNNGGRNVALAHGRALPHARWILPLDGNCFFTPSAMQSLIDTITGTADQQHSPRYVVIPMSRLLDNEAALPSNTPLVDNMQAFSAPPAPEEPQIGFRFDASESYQSAMRYGRRSKLELLWRLGAVLWSRDLHRRMLPWETNDRQILTGDSYASIKVQKSQTAFVNAGWVFRLFSGDSRQEVHSAEATILRNMNRVRGIVAFLERLDEILVRGKRCSAALPGCGFTKDLLWSVNTTSLASFAWQVRQGDHQDRIRSLVRQAEGVKIGLDSLLGVPHLIEAMDAHEASLQAASLAWAGHLTGNGSYTHAAATLVRLRFFADTRNYDRLATPSKLDVEEGSGYVFPMPAATYGKAGWLQATLPSTQWPADFDATQLLDTLRLLSPAHLSRSMRKTIDELLPSERIRPALFAHLARLLSRSKEVKSLEDGAAFDLQVASLASAVDDVQLLGRVASRAALRLKRDELPTLSHRWLAEGLRRVHHSGGDRSNEVDGRRLLDDREQGETQLASWGEAFAALKL